MEDKIPIRFHSTAAFVTDIEKAKNFYTSVLGQQIELDFGKNVILRCGITLWEISVQHIIPQKVGADATGNQSYNRFEFYFETEQIEQMVERLKHAGVVFLHLLHDRIQNTAP